MSIYALMHICAISFWFGVVGAEFVIERSRADSREHGFAVARNHFWIDVLLEGPVAVVVLISGCVLLLNAPLTPLLGVKILAGSTAVIVNILCLAPVILRKRAADRGELGAVIKHSAWIDRITVVGLPAALLALILGVL